MPAGTTTTTKVENFTLCSFVRTSFTSFFCFSCILSHVVSHVGKQDLLTCCFLVEGRKSYYFFSFFSKSFIQTILYTLCTLKNQTKYYSFFTPYYRHLSSSQPCCPLLQQKKETRVFLQCFHLDTMKKG